MPRRRAIPVALGVACYALALLQRPGTVYADTKVDLLVDPLGFLGEVTGAWTEQIGLGHVFGGQYGGYLFPMGPWFALGDLAGLPDWVVQRLWLGTVLAAAAWGVVTLLDALLDRARGAPHAAAAAIFVLNPYVAVYANRTTITLLAYAALPWLLLAVHRGLREPRAWRWPALFALVLTATGGGVNVAVTGWVLVGPALFMAYERWFGGVGPGAIRPFLLRLAPVVAAASAWWLAPVVVHALYGLDFLPFTEQPGTIWQTTSITESLRLTGFWTSYIGSGFGGVLRPYASNAPALLFDPAVLVASLLVPALACAGFAWTARWRYGPWFLLLALTGLLIMAAGFPEGTPLRRALTFTYNRVEALQFLRTTYKAGPLLALGLAGLGGAAFGVLWDRAGRTALRLGAAGAGALLLAVAAWPLASGRAPERQLAFTVPAWWTAAAREVDGMPAGERAMVLPGRLFAYYDWGGTVDPILPALAERPVAERMIVPFADLRAADLQIATDALVSQERAVPGQLPPLLDLLGVGRVFSSADDDRSRSGAIGPVEADEQLRRGGLGPGRGLGPLAREPAAAGRTVPARRLPRITVRSARTGGMVRVVPRAGATVLDGGAEGVTQLAAFGLLAPGAALRYAADLTPEDLRGEVRAGAGVVVSDTNRRQAFVAARLRANRGPVLAAGQSLSEDGAMLDPFPGAGPDAQTVAELQGAASITAPASPQTTQFPEHRPYAAVDGDPATAWLADRALARDRHYVTLRFAAPRDLATIEVLPYDDERGRVLELEVDGRRVAVRPGWNRIAVDRRGASSLRVAIREVSQPEGVSGGAGGIRELRVPGVRVREFLRPPVLAERALAGGPSPASLTYLLSRITVDAPLRTAPPVDAFQSALVRDRVDPEARLVRRIAPPAARTYAAEAWTSPDPVAPDGVLDRLAGTTGPVRASSSGRFGGLAAHRASRALDGRPGTAWIAPWVRRAGGTRTPSATLRIALERPRTIRRLVLVAAPRTRRPRRVLIEPLGAELAVGPGGVVALPRALRTRTLEITVTDAAFAPGTSGRARQARAMGIAEVRGLGVRVRDGGGALRGRCGDASVRTADGVVALRPVGPVAALERGAPLRARGCRAARLPAGRQEVAGGGGPLRVDQLALISGRPRRATARAGRVLEAGSDAGQGKREGIRLRIDEPAWLVYGESYNRGWRATCDGRDLGAPVPLQGYANAWRVPPGCERAALAWAPNRLLAPAYLVSLVGVLALLAVLLRRRRSAGAPARRRPLLPDPDPPARWAPRRAVAAGLGAAVVLGFVFAIRAGVLMGPAVAAILWLGIPTRRLVLAAAGLLGVVVPVLYLAVPVRNPGGFNSNLAVERIAAHWVGAAAVFLLLVALTRTLAAARAASRP